MSREVWDDEGPEDRPGCDAVAITERILWLARNCPPHTQGLIVNRPHGGMTHGARLFQAGMWRCYAADWNLPDWNHRRGWVEKVLRRNRAECVRRARVNLYLARRLRRVVH